MLAGPSLLAQLYRTVTSSEAPILRPFVSAAFASLLGSCPGLGARLFGDLIPIGPGTPEVLVDVPVSFDNHLDIVIEGEDDCRLLIENRLAPDLEWFEERTEIRPPSHADHYIAAARHRYGGRARVLVLTRTEGDLRKRRYPTDVYAGSRTWASLYEKLEGELDEAEGIPAHLIRQFLDLLKDHDMNPSEPLSVRDADTILAFDHFARNSLKLLDDAVGRIRQEFDLKGTPNNRRLTGWYACSDRFQSDELHFFFYLMFPPVPDLVVRAAVQVTKESTPRGLAAAAEHGFRRGRWGSLWIERDFRRQHPFLSLPVQRQLEELVRFFQAPLARLSKTGLVKPAPAQHEEALSRKAAASHTASGESSAGGSSSPEEARSPSQPAGASIRGYGGSD